MTRSLALLSGPVYGSRAGGASSRIDIAASQSAAGQGAKCAARSGALRSTSRRNACSSSSIQGASSMVELSTPAIEKSRQATLPAGFELSHKRIPVRICAVEILATLMHEPRTTAQLLEQVGSSNTAMRLWLREFHNSGLIRVSGFVEREGPGPREKIFSLQTKPFALPDAVYQPPVWA